MDTDTPTPKWGIFLPKSQNRAKNQTQQCCICITFAPLCSNNGRRTTDQGEGIEGYAGEDGGDQGYRQ